jgi:hypothetical protein
VRENAETKRGGGISRRRHAFTRRPPHPCYPACPGCGLDPRAEGVTTCRPKDVRGRQPEPHSWPEPTTAEEIELFTDHNPCPCGAMPGGYHHWECSLEVCPWADEHPDDGEQLLYCGCYE